MKNKRSQSIMCSVAVAALSVCGDALGTVTFDWATIGNAGNAGDFIHTANKGPGLAANGTTGYGAVSYDFRISKTHVTNAQYVEFLNTIDSTGANTLKTYDSNMTTQTVAGPAFAGGIDFTAGAANGSKYSVKPGQANYPAVWLNWVSSARFVNWLSNGQGTGSTETGVYNLTQAVPTRAAGATFFIPNENEFYKAAYYDPTKNGGAGGYWEFGTRSEANPTGEAPVGGANSANIRNANDVYWADNSTAYNSVTDHLVNVGSYANATSAYGLYDVDGNVYQWNENFFTVPATGFTGPIYRGGTWLRGPTTSAGASLRAIYSTASSPSYSIFGLRLAGSIVATTSNWNVDADGNFSTASNWSAGVPTGVDFTASFGSFISAARTVTLDSSRVLGTISFNNVNSYTIAGANTLTLEVSSGSAHLNVITGQQHIAAPVILADDTIATVTAGAQLELNNVTGAAGTKLTKADAGKLVVSNLVVDTLNIQGGEVTPGAVTPSKIKSLQVDARARLNLGEGGKLFIDYTGGSPLAAVAAMIADGRLLTTAADRAVGFGEASALGLGAPTPDDASTLYLVSTYAGDATLNRTVGFDDLVRLAQNYGGIGTKTWTDGDFNGDQAVNFADLVSLAQNYNKSANLEGPAGFSAAFSADWALAQSLVPEPGSVALVAMCLCGMRRRFTTRNHS